MPDSDLFGGAESRSKIRKVNMYRRNTTLRGAASRIQAHAKLLAKNVDESPTLLSGQN
jgi:hypothetical protein